jgi:hypothetical protein
MGYPAFSRSSTSLKKQQSDLEEEYQYNRLLTPLLDCGYCEPRTHICIPLPDANFWTYRVSKSPSDFYPSLQFLCRFPLLFPILR